MENDLDALKKFLASLTSVGFWDRVFGWKKIQENLVEASAGLHKMVWLHEHLKEALFKKDSALDSQQKDLHMQSTELIRRENELVHLRTTLGDFQNRVTMLSADLSATQALNKALNTQINQVSTGHELLSQKYSQLQSENKVLAGESASQTQTINELSKRKGELDIEGVVLRRDLQQLQSEVAELRKVNTQLQKEEEFRKLEHSNAVAALSRIQDQIQGERNREVEEKNAKEVARIRNLKETWSRHQETAKNILKSICQKHTIPYIEKVSFKGDPDNTLMICEEYIVFDAKSPGGEDMGNFPFYLKDQAEKAKKYARQESVKPDIFFVVPSNTLDFLNTFVYRHGDHNVYIISLDALEPVILGLKKIEEYEFAEQLSPEDRENICRVLGRFAHLSKRRIQVDNFFARQFLELAYKCESALPKELLDSVLEYEKAEKMNPPQEKRVKAIPIGEVEKDYKKIKLEAESRGIFVEDPSLSDSLNALPLYKPTEG
ncbi:MAG: hypothetical protein ACXVBI_06410 [Flavisolibacter sp.]